MAATPRARIALRAPTGDLVAGIRARAAAMPKAQRQVAVAMLHAPDFALRANVDDLARRAGVSPPTIVRFCRALGFAGLKDFKLRLAQSLAVETSTLHRAVAPGDTMAAVVHKSCAASARSRTSSNTSCRAVEAAVVRIARSRRLLQRGHVDVHGNDAQALLAAGRVECVLRRLRARVRREPRPP
jgi:RpiR family carbohydrate utilization transcriptional regulator